MARIDAAEAMISVGMRAQRNRVDKNEILIQPLAVLKS
jgi:hypothetical protein